MTSQTIIEKRINSLRIILLLSCLLISYAQVYSQDSAHFMQQGDALWEKRQAPANARASINAYQKVLEMDADSYEACWKIARCYFYLGDLLPETKEMRKSHQEMGAKGMRYAEKALKLNSRAVEGHYYYTLCLAQYSIGISIIKAIAKGLGPDYEQHVGKAIDINKHFDNAGPLRAFGRYWYRLPWPKRDLKKSIRYLKEAVACAPAILRGHVYLAESYLKAGEKELAREHLQEAIAVTPDLKQEVDALRWQARARTLLEQF